MTYNFPDKEGKFGKFGGKYVPETLMPAINHLDDFYEQIKNDNDFCLELQDLYQNFIGRPTPLYYSNRLSKLYNAKIYFKREDLTHTGAHKINNAIGQALIAKKMGKDTIIAETGAGQHGVATASACALLSMKCKIYMGSKDIKRQYPNILRMKLLGAEIIEVNNGSKSLKNAINQAMKDWIANIDNSYYLIGTVAGPHPYPKIVRDFHSIIGKESKKQILEIENKLPDALIASIGGGSNAIGLFYPFIDDEDVKIYGVEAAGKGLLTKENAASIAKGRYGILHGNLTYFLQNADGQIDDAHSISAGLDYPGIGPEHAHLHNIKRVKYISATDEEALTIFKDFTKNEGIIPALESSHAIAKIKDVIDDLNINSHNKDIDRKKIIIINLSGRGDKDLDNLFNNKND